MSLSKNHVALFFERNPALCGRKEEVLSRIPNSDWIDEGEIRQAMGDVLFGYFQFDMRHDKPLRGKTGAKGGDSYMGVTLSYVP